VSIFVRLRIRKKRTRLLVRTPRLLQGEREEEKDTSVPDKREERRIEKSGIKGKRRKYGSLALFEHEGEGGGADVP